MSTIIQVSVLPESHHPRVSQNVKHVGESGGVVKSAIDYNNCEHSRLQKLHQHQNLTQNHHHHSHQQPQVLPKQLDLSNSDNALLSVYCFIKNFIGAPAGTSTVAIDNKIEQAMDLVKSHLMFAVREEVDVLKEKITELMDRISQLELENGILKANATQETLSQLPPASGTQVNPQLTQQNTQNTQTGTQTLPTNGGQIIRPPNSNQNQTQNNQQTTTS